MDPYVQKWPRKITWETWRALAHPDVPALPWTADNGAEVCSFALEPVEHLGEIMVLLYDAHGNEVVRSASPAEHGAIEATAVALGGRVNELTFLPPPRR